MDAVTTLSGPAAPTSVGTAVILGAGVMGRGVATAIARAGMNAVVVDRSDDVLEQSRNALRNDIRAAALIAGGGAGSEEDVMVRMTLSTDLDCVKDADLVIENVTEKWTVKKPLYERLDGLCRESAVIAVNTSAIPITRLAGLTSRPAQVIGAHFMNPAAITTTVEVIRGYHTSEETEAFLLGFLTRIGKRAIVVKDSPGFVTNRVMMLTINEAVFTLMEGVSSAADIDRLFVECFGHRMGPLETADLIGLDTVLLSLEVLYDSFKDGKYRPCPLLCQMVDAGLHGRKSGEGFFDYQVAL